MSALSAVKHPSSGDYQRKILEQYRNLPQDQKRRALTEAINLLKKDFPPSFANHAIKILIQMTSEKSDVSKTASVKNSVLNNKKE